MEAGIHELTAGYALDALDPEERRVYEEHLSSCERCREELASFWATSEALAIGVAGPAPDADLRGRILTAARAEPQVVVPLRARSRRTVPALAAVAAAAAVVAVGIGVWAAHLHNELGATRSALARTQGAAAILADPAARNVRLKAGEGRLVVDPNGRAALVLGGLDPAPSGKTYEVWIIKGSTPRRAGLFPGRQGGEVVGVEGTVAAGDVVAVTIEDAGGRDAPTSPPVVASVPA